MDQKKHQKPCNKGQQSQSKGRAGQSQEHNFSGGGEQGGERTGK